jgi:hypothetical protein
MSSDGLPHQVGGFDPLLDDSVDFNTRIRRLGVPGEMRIHRTLPHTFLSFPHWLHTVPEVQPALALSIEWLPRMHVLTTALAPSHSQVQQALALAAEEVSGVQGAKLKQRMRTGTVVTTDDRNWELRYSSSAKRFSQSRAIAIDMESASLKPMIAFSGVRSSWLIVARKVDFARLPASAASRARSCSRAISRSRVTSSTIDQI